ncbi:type I phosphodiesterase/nucleotide pyrophosphatase [Acidianus hospitalis W1]|uniref:Type I phosphodiesterase/nucleotide pyrophosphatase n=1 Tax=Acidianus hospitalis (strain W1) TaxID=933801 RepID=F4B8L1_ACIHW|nr:alkaline phosphatase family protein [Acidianus hospitalis]AEE94963.1 type I phosphodiesterase/nucleotide pyrophosphatase [Acidianus hospitalis W1]
MIYPDYSKNNLYNVACSIEDALVGGKACCSNITLSDKIFLVLVDGMGYNILKSAVEGIKFDKIYTVFPSTTATALTTLMTATKPGEHKILGYTTYVDKVGVINALKYTMPETSEVDLLKKALGKSMEEVFNVKSIGKKAREKGKKSVSILPKCIAGSEFTKMLYTNVEEYRTLWDGIYKAKIFGEKGVNFITLYIPDVDLTAHRYGPYAEPTLRAVKDIISMILRDIPKGYDIIITADHGFIQTENAIMLDEDKDFVSSLDSPPFGDARAIFMRSRKDLKCLEEKFSSFKVFTIDEVKELGLLAEKGEKIDIHADYLGIPTDRKVYVYRFKNGYAGHKGHHGAMLEEEMEIPLIRYS